MSDFYLQLGQIAAAIGFVMFLALGVLGFFVALDELRDNRREKVRARDQIRERIEKEILGGRFGQEQDSK